MNNTQKKALKRMRAMELLTGEIKTKYPKNSMIVFHGECVNGEDPVTLSCGWYNKKGRPDGKMVNRKNIVSKPPEWQNIPYDEALKIAEIFDNNMILKLNYV
jgi:hypothetical protein